MESLVHAMARDIIGFSKGYIVCACIYTSYIGESSTMTKSMQRTRCTVGVVLCERASHQMEEFHPFGVEHPGQILLLV